MSSEHFLALESSEHFLALERFWNDAIEEKVDTMNKASVTEAVLVLPRNYGWDMSRPDDRR